MKVSETRDRLPMVVDGNGRGASAGKNRASDSEQSASLRPNLEAALFAKTGTFSMKKLLWPTKTSSESSAICSRQGWCASSHHSALCSPINCGRAADDSSSARRLRFALLLDRLES